MIHSQAMTEYQRQTEHYAAVKRRLYGLQPRKKPMNDNVIVCVVESEPAKLDRWDKKPIRFDWHVIAYLIHRTQGADAETKCERRSFDEICYDVLESFRGISLAEIKGKSRDRSLILPRHATFWLIRQLRKDDAASHPAIGRWCGGRDHTTVLHAVRKIDAMIQRGELEWLRRLAN